MKTTLKFVVSSAMLTLLSACGGGGGGDGTTSTAASNKTELEGTWVYASAGHTTGSACGLDIHGGIETRVTYTFEGSTLHSKLETCAILTGNTGGFVQTDATTGTFVLGDAYMTVGTETYKAIDVTSNGTTQYSGYALSGNTFKQAGATAGNDGSTAATRRRGTGIQGAGTFVKQ